MSKDKFLGYTFRDKITGFQGVCTGYASYITGCDQASLLPTVKDNTMKDGGWFDINRLEKIPEATKVILETKQKTDKGSMAAPSKL